MKIPHDTQVMLKVAVRLLNTHELSTEDIVRAVYYIGWLDGGLNSQDKAQALIESALPELFRSNQETQH